MKRTIRKALALEWAERYTLARVWFLLWAVRLGLWLLPFRDMWRVTQRLAEGCSHSQTNDRSRVDRIVWSVNVASRLVPRATCLTRAMVVQILLARCGFSPRLRIGVARSEDGRLLAHAWVVHGDRVVMGGTEVDSYTLLPSFEVNLP